MKIRRHPARSQRYDADWHDRLHDTDARAKWDAADGHVVLRVDDAQDPENSGCRHHWQVSLSLNDIAEILVRLSSEGIQSAPVEVQGALQSHAVHLVRLLACAAGNVPGPVGDTGAEPHA